jgi:hypothetical protein
MDDKVDRKSLDDNKPNDSEQLYPNEKLDREHLWCVIGDNEVPHEIERAIAQNVADELFGDRRVLIELQKSHPELVVVAYRKVLYEYLLDFRVAQAARAARGETE